MSRHLTASQATGTNQHLLLSTPLLLSRRVLYKPRDDLKDEIRQSLTVQECGNDPPVNTRKTTPSPTRKQ